ncbi:MAG: hypothetical protein H7175_18435 [Burkholderiales bacterium]|nr:hypothetical protein [Anaerolineae bacterium]
MMQFTREINRLLFGVLLAFAVVAVAAAYWAVVGPDTIVNREDNPRLIEDEASIQRGSIVDRRGEPLVESVMDGGLLTRQYMHPEIYDAIGYFSLRYGVGGAEAAYDAILRGDDVERGVLETFSNKLLHRSQRGSDIRLTFDLEVQRAVSEAMQGQRGAVVVLAVPGGEVLALVSLPTYDPNTLDADWETLIAAEGNPFFNRVLQGRYQPGGALQTPLLAAALLSNTSLDGEVENATQPVIVDDVALTCAVRLPDVPLTLREAYGFACPQPFADLAQSLGPIAVQSTFDTFHLDEPPTLPGFVVEPVESDDSTPAPTVSPETPTEVTITTDNVLQNALGQGELTVTPMEMAVIAAAIVNDGNAPQPYTLVSIRPPDTATWTPIREVRPTIPISTTNTARQLQDLMRNTVANGAAQNAGRPNIDIGGHAALAYSGESSQAWFVGFATLGGRSGIAVAVVLENSADPGLAADIGGTALAAAHAALQQE